MTRTWFARRRGSQLRLECLEDRTVPSTFTVNTTLDAVNASDGKLSLREAITKANTHAGADVIVLPAGVFKTALAGANENANATGDFDITDAVTIQGAGAGASIVDGQQLDRVFDVLGTAPSSIRVVLQGLTERNGLSGNGGGIAVGNADLVVRDAVVSGNRASAIGAGISNSILPGTGNVTLIRTTVSHNVAGGSGGGVSVSGGSSVLTVKDSTIRRNIATGNGGGIRAGTATLTNCTVSGNSADLSGGGILATIAATVTNCTISGNSGLQGGGILTSTATVTSCTISGNVASSAGGGLGANTATLTSCTITGNSAGTNGGGILSPTVTLTHSTVSGNFATSNGGGINAITTATLTNSTVSGNHAVIDGGGIWGSAATLTNSTASGNFAGGNAGGILSNNATLTRSTVSGNSAGTTGGGILSPTVVMTNSTVSGNSANNEAGGIWATNATLLNCTISDNSASIGGGLFHNPGGTFNVKNTIVALNLTDFTGTGPDVNGDFTSGGHNLIGNGVGGTGFTNGVNGDLVGTAANSIDPKLGPPANNGGKTETRKLLAGSPAIDAGDNAGAPTTDQRGLPRKKDGNGDGIAIVDIGAFEK